jgi:hypothetical protein
VDRSADTCPGHHPTFDLLGDPLAADVIDQ